MRHGGSAGGLLAHRECVLVGKWPNEKDRPVDRARQVAAEYRRALAIADPDACAAIDSAAVAAGETWVSPTVAIHDLDDLVSVADAAEMCARSVRWVYAWIAKDRTNRVKGDSPTRVRIGDVLDAVAYERDWRTPREG
jgi:hypothetical protein